MGMVLWATCPVPENLFILPGKLRISARHFGKYIDTSGCIPGKKNEGRKNKGKTKGKAGGREKEKE